MSLVALLTALWCVGCLYQGTATAVDPARLAPDVERVEGVPLVEQQSATDCGAAAVAAIIEYWRKGSGDPAEVRRAVGVPNGQTIKAGLLRDYLRRRGFDAFLIRGELGDLRREVAAGRPVVVGMLKPHVADQWLAHYEVVVGVGSDTVVTMDPAAGWRQYPISGFQQEWVRAERVTLIIAPRSKEAQSSL